MATSVLPLRCTGAGDGTSGGRGSVLEMWTWRRCPRGFCPSCGNQRKEQTESTSVWILPLFYEGSPTGSETSTSSSSPASCGARTSRMMSPKACWPSAMENCQPPFLGETPAAMVARVYGRYAPGSEGPPPPERDGTEPEAGPTPQSEKRVIPYVDLEEIARNGIPPVPWLVPGWLAEQDIALVAGPAGCGKTTTVYSLGLALAEGSAWCGLEIVRPCRVLIVDEEQGTRDAARTLMRLGAPRPNLRLLSMAGIRFSASEGVALLQEAVEDFRPEVVILDSLTQIFAVQNENDASQVGERFHLLFDLRDEFGTAFIGIHHRGKEIPGGPQRAGIDKPRGSTVYGTQASTVWLVAPVSREALDLQQAKRRSADIAETRRIGYSADGSEGRITLSGQVVDPLGEMEKTADDVIDFLAGRDNGEASTGDIEKAVPKSPNVTKPSHTRAVNRALKYLVTTGAITKVKRGLYRMAEGSDETPF